MGRRRHLHMTDMYERVANDQSLPKFTSEQFAAMPAHEQHRHGIRVLAAMLDQRDPAGASLVQQPQTAN
jgi:hypothetical protein